MKFWFLLFLYSIFLKGEQLQEFGSKYEPEALRSSKKTDLADVIIYVYDSSDTNSFSYISNLRVSACTSAKLSTLINSLSATVQSESHSYVICSYESGLRPGATGMGFTIVSQYIYDVSIQRHEVQPDVYCRRLGLQVPVSVSVKDGHIADVFHFICSIALKP